MKICEYKCPLVFFYKMFAVEELVGVFYAFIINCGHGTLDIFGQSNFIMYAIYYLINMFLVNSIFISTPL